MWKQYLLNSSWWSTLIDADWWRDLIHWYSNWIAYCPVLAIASTKTVEEAEKVEQRFLSKFLFSLLIQVTVGVLGAFGGSYLTLTIVSYRMDLAEQNIKSLQVRLVKVEESAAADRSDLAVMKDRHRMEDILRIQPRP